MIIGGKDFDRKKHTYILGILNVTPDSFSDSGRYTEIDKALFRAQEMLDEGADIIDVGGESTRPDAVPVSAEEETERIYSVIERIKRELGAIISVDTYKAEVVSALMDLGIDMINDVHGLKGEGMAQVVAKAGLPVCIMHNGSIPQTADAGAYLKEAMNDLIDDAVAVGVKKENIILDPGIGFGKDTYTNLKILSADDFGMPDDFPILLGASRKSFIGQVLGLETGQRLEGTLAVTQLAVNNRALFVRVHDIKENARFIKMAEAIRDCR